MRSMRLDKLIPVLLLAASAASAPCKITENTTTPAAGCPIAIQTFGQTFINPDLLGNFHMSFKNISDKPILGVVFHLDVMDAVGNLAPAAIAPQFTGKVAPGKGKSIAGNLLEYYQREPAVPGGRLYVETISFVDGSTWKDDGSKSCRMVIDDRR